MTEEVQQFYDSMAAKYTYIFPDWQQAVSKQGQALASLLKAEGFDASTSVLDCTCGVGTQTIGLALQGYPVHGTDLSPRAIARAETFAAQFRLKRPPTFAVADLLHPAPPERTYPVVISCDNAIAHFHSEADLTRALQTMLAQLDEDGLLLLSLRDYDALLSEPPRTTPVRINDTRDERVLVFQVWDWDDTFSAYRMEMFFLYQGESGWRTQSFVSHLRAWQRDDLERILRNNGLTNVIWHMPERSGYYQPMVCARKAR